VDASDRCKPLHCSVQQQLTSKYSCHII
jgi:hypothetical protein